MSLADLSIRRKLTLTTAAASGIALFLASLGFVLFDVSRFDDSIEHRLVGDAEIVGYNSASAIVFRDPEAGARTLTALRAERDVVLAAVYDDQGALFASYVRRGMSESPPAAAPEAPSEGVSYQGNRVVVVRPVVFESQRVGTVLIRADLSELWARLRRYGLIVGVVSLGAFVAAFFVGLRVQRAISEPVLSLARTAAEVSDRNDFSVRAVARSRDELGVLVSTFNQMLDGLQRRDEQLQRAHGELERRIEERTALYREAEEANRLKDQFLATLSHELRTPLNAIVGWTRMLADGQLDPDTQARAVASIDRNARAQTKLIEDILDVSRIVSGKLHLNVRAVDLGALVQAGVDSVAHAAEAKEIRLESSVDPAAAAVSGDPDRLQQVLWNLLSNAIKFTPRGGRVSVRVTRPDSQVEIVVADDGIGIRPEFLPHVFERFRQADASSTRAHGGLGLGLAIVRHLVELHGGTVRTESPGEGKGATFRVLLPLATAEPRVAWGDAAGRTARADLGGPNLRGVRVLVVEDEQDSMELIRTALARLGAEVVAAGGTEEALARFDAAVPDVIVSDIEMPGHDGYELIRRIRARPPEHGGHVPAAALTAYARTEDRRQALLAGFQMHVAKPIEPEELVAVVASLAGKTGSV
jgi:signal transduction histidine kinase/CheY-like chemotaxis protein